MRHNNQISFIILSLFLCFSCQEKSSNKEFPEKSTSLESRYKNLEDFEWLSDVKNFSEESYQERFKKHYNQSLENDSLENAAAYLIAYGASSKPTQLYDSLYLNKALKFYEKNKDLISGEAKSHLCYYVGVQFFNSVQFDQSSKWYKKSIEFETESSTHHQIKGLSHLLLAQNYLEQRKLHETEEHLINALKIFEKIGDKENQGKVYLLMHTLYLRNLAFDKAEDILKKSIDIFEQVKSNYFAFNAHITYVHFHIEQGDTLNGIHQVDKMVDFAKNYEDITEYHKGFVNQFLAFKFIAQKNEDSARYYLDNAKEIAEKTGITDLKMRNFYWEISFTNQFNKLLENPEEAEWFFQELGKAENPNVQYMLQLAGPLYYFYKQKGDYKKANEYCEFLVRDSYKQSGDRLKKQLFELEIKYETEKKEKTILLQEKKLAQTNKIIALLIGAFVFVLLIILLAFIWNKNRSILKQKELAENFSSQLLQKTEDERKRIASDLHDSVSNELVNLRHAIENTNVQLHDKIDFILEEVRNVSRNISPILFDKIGFKASVEQLTERIQNQHNFFISAEIDYNGDLETDKELQLYRIIQEAITNILKHANAVAGKVTITENAHFINVEIKDNGKGFNVDKMLEKGNCFGLLNITERTKFLNGTVNFQSDHKGTIIQLSIPK